MIGQHTVSSKHKLFRGDGKMRSEYMPSPEGKKDILPGSPEGKRTDKILTACCPELFLPPAKGIADFKCTTARHQWIG